MKQILTYFIIFIISTITLQAQAQSVKEYLKKSKKQEKLGNKRQASYYLNQAATIEWEEKNYQVAIKHFKKSIQLNQGVNNKNGIAMINNNIGMIYADMYDYENALKHFEKTLKYRRQKGDKTNLIPSLINISVILNDLKRHDKAANYLEEALKIARESSNAPQMRSCYGMLAETYEKAGNTEKSIHYFNLYRSFHELVQKEKEDVLKSEAENARLEAQLLESEKRNKELEILAKEKTIKDKNQKINEYDATNRKLLKNLSKKELLNNVLKSEAELKEKDAKIKEIRLKELKAEHEASRLKSQITIYLFIGGTLFLAVILTVFYFRYREKQKTNRLLSEQNEEITQQRDAIQEQKEAIEQQGQVIYAERQKSENLLLNILPKSIAEELKVHGKAKMRHYEKVSILFTDFKDFTTIASRLSSEELMEELNYCFSNFDRIIAKHNMEKIKTIGDSYMCAGGIPDANTNNPIDSILAALEIQDFMIQERQKRQDKGENYWQCRLGINTGEVRAGVIGESKFAYDVWGDAVNLASRMESGGAVGKVNVSEHTYELVKDFFDFTPRGNVEVKNGLILNMYFVNRIKVEFSADEKGIVPNKAFEQLRHAKIVNTINI